MNTKIKYQDSFIVTYLPPTNTKGSRVKIYNEQEKEIIPYNYNFSSIRDVAVNYLKEKGYNVSGYSDLGYGYLILID